MYNTELFINGSDLPKPLSDNDLNDLLYKVKQGDMEARNIIAVHNIRFVFHEVITTFKTVDYNKRDLVSLGIIGLLKAINTFDIDKNIKFATYAKRCIDNEILIFLRKIKKDEFVDSFEKTIKIDNDGIKYTIIDTIYYEKDFVEDIVSEETYKILNAIINKLPDREKEIIKLYFGFYNKCYNQEEISRKFSISQSYISRVIKKTVKNISHELEQQGILVLKEKTNSLTTQNNF